MHKHNAIGIDLGTTNSCVAIFVNGSVKIIPNEYDQCLTPSFVSFTEKCRIFGSDAKNRCTTNPLNTVYGVLRLVGRKFSDPLVQDDIRNFPFKVISSEDDKPIIQVEYLGEIKNFTPQEIIAMNLFDMKMIAESFLGTIVKDAVISIPVHFNRPQWDAIKDAGAIAGLNVIRLINSPQNAAVAYDLQMQKAKGEKNLFVFDLGGGTLDVAISTVEDGIVEVKAIAGDSHLGGEDFDTRIVNFCIREFEAKHEKNLLTDPRALIQLRNACERAKRNLSTSAEALIEVDSLIGGIDFSIKITRDQFEMLCDDLFKLTLVPIGKVLRDAGMEKDEIDEIILVGGSTRIPKIQKLISDIFLGKKHNESINPDEVVAYGAAISAAVLSGDKSEAIQDKLLLDVLPFSLGIETPESFMDPLIKRNTTIPTKTAKTITIFTEDPSTVPPIRIYEGEHEIAERNLLIGQIQICDIVSRGVSEIEICFDIDANTGLNVSATNKDTGKQNKITVQNNAERLSRDEIERMVNDEITYKQNDEDGKKQIEIMNNVQSFASRLKEYFTDRKVECEKIVEWLDIKVPKKAHA